MNEWRRIECEDTSDGAAVGLLGLMKGISEEYWCAGWMSGLEFDLWQAPAWKRYGQGVITERQATLLRLLSEECDGWWYYDNDPQFIRRKDWIARCATLSQKEGDH